jgi:hypothetical protein
MISEYYPWITTQIAVASGHRILISGGMPMRDSKRVVYVFLTAKLVGIQGQDINVDVD